MRHAAAAAGNEAPAVGNLAPAAGDGAPIGRDPAALAFWQTGQIRSFRITLGMKLSLYLGGPPMAPWSTAPICYHATQKGSAPRPAPASPGRADGSPDRARAA